MLNIEKQKLIADLKAFAIKKIEPVDLQDELNLPIEMENDSLPRNLSEFLSSKEPILEFESHSIEEQFALVRVRIILKPNFKFSTVIGNINQSQALLEIDNRTSLGFLIVEEEGKIIEQLIKKVQSKKFKLASGQESNVYIDVKQIALRAGSMHNLAKLLINSAKTFGKYNAIAGVPIGGLHLASIMAMYDSPMNVIMIRNQIKDHGTQSLIESPIILGKVVLVEDVITTGKSVLKAAKQLEKEGFTIAGIISVVDRRYDSTFLGFYNYLSLINIEELMK